MISIQNSDFSSERRRVQEREREREGGEEWRGGNRKVGWVRRKSINTQTCFWGNVGGSLIRGNRGRRFGDRTVDAVETDIL